MRPLLSATLKPKTGLQFPYLGSPKLDGIRTLVLENQAVSRTLKPIHNQAIRELLSSPLLNGLDGELLVGDPAHPDVFRHTTTVVMAHNKPIGDVVFAVFDDFSNPKLPFADRLESAAQRINKLPEPLKCHVSLVHHTWIHRPEALENFEKHTIDAGYEGIMLRRPDGIYKFGRSTEKEQILLKVKRFADSEAIVVGFEELMHNNNTQTTDNLGHAKRSTHQENLAPAGTLGALIVKDCDTNIEFGIGTGFTSVDREEIWQNREAYLGRMLTYKHFPHGAKDAPRHPVFKFWREAGV